MATVEKMHTWISEEMDEVPLVDLPDDQEFAKQIVRELPPEEALKAIDAYTAYICRRTYCTIED